MGRGSGLTGLEAKTKRKKRVDRDKDSRVFLSGTG